MTTPPWCMEKVIAYYFIIYYGWCGSRGEVRKRNSAEERAEVAECKWRQV